MTSFLKLIRWRNLVLIALSQILIKYALIESFQVVQFKLNDFGFSLLVIATLCVAAAGNIINDIHDIETDLINKPNKVIIGQNISERSAFILYVILSTFGVGIGFYISNLVNQTNLSAIFIITSALLYLYATYLKQIALIGNIVISLMVALSLILVGLFELLPVISQNNQVTQLTFFKIIIDYAIFAFIINLLREIIKDIEDFNGDCKAKMKTLPILIGKKRSLGVSFSLSIILLILIVYYVVNYFYRHYILVAYFLICIITPLLFFSIKSVTAKNKKDIISLSKLLKVIMLFGLLSLLLYPLILK